jgi:hypothetical protein
MKPAIIFSIAFAISSAVLVTSPAHAQPSQQPQSSGFQIQEIDSGVVAAADARFTEINDRAATLVGGYVGWLTDRRLLVGGGGYWLANRDDDFKMQYGGGLVRWTFFADRKVGLSAGTFVGFGNATLARPYGELFDVLVGTRLGGRADMPGLARRLVGNQAIPTDIRFRLDETFVLAEPQITAVWSATPWMRVEAGVGYRFIGAADLLGDELRGPSGSIAIQFGGW